MELPAPTDSDVRQIVDLVVDAVQPLRVVLFGSAARDEQRVGSDLDLMVVVPEGVDRRAVARSLYELMYEHRVMVPTQFVVTTPSDFEAHKDTTGMVYRDIERDGREVYAA
jgi:uncharacterized protein